MNLFWKKLFGGFVSTEKYEQGEEELLQSMMRFDKVAESPELKEYQELFHVVKSASFQDNRHTLKNRKYKDTEEYSILKKYNKLHNSSDIQLYFQVLNSDILAEYLEFEKTPEYEQLGDKKKVAQSAELTKFKKFEHSEMYKTYRRFYGSYALKEYEQLKEKVADPEFIKSNEFWSNPQRWHTTAEYQTEMRYYELGDLDDVKFYTNEKPARFEKLRLLTKTFDDQFYWSDLQESKWRCGYYYSNEKLKSNHSFANEMQANNHGKNVVTQGGVIKIETKSEQVSDIAWHNLQGFINRQFSYTSDVIQTANNFNQKYGLFTAKIKCYGSINHSVWLGTGEKQPRISLFHYDGKSIKVGAVTSTKTAMEKVSGISPAEYYIYTLMWTENELVWKINNVEVYRTPNNFSNQEMYLGLNSFISESQKASTGSLELQWVKVYSSN
jgi:hypothetical protein